MNINNYSDFCNSFLVLVGNPRNTKKHPSKTHSSKPTNSPNYQICKINECKEHTKQRHLRRNGGKESRFYRIRMREEKKNVGLEIEDRKDEKNGRKDL